MTPKVSVCVPVHNGVRYLSTTLRSVLDQTLTDFELVVYDNASTDGTADVLTSIDDPRLRIVTGTELVPPAESWSRALRAATAPFVKILCADDVLYSDCLERQTAALSGAPGATMVASKRDVADAGGRLLITGRGLAGLRGTTGGSDVVRRIVRSGTNIIGEPLCVLMRTAATQEVGTFSSHVAYMIDVEYWCRMVAGGELLAIDHVAGYFRVHDSSWSGQLARRQAREARELFRDLACAHEGVTRFDVGLGATRARLLAFGRGAVYRYLGVRNRAPKVIKASLRRPDVAADT